MKKRQSIDSNTKIIEMLELFGKDFNTTIIEMLRWAIKKTLEK
jgi:hypothetical protein